MFWSNRPSELDCDFVVEVLVCPVWSVNSCLGLGGAVTTNSNCDRGLTPSFLLRISCVSNSLSVAPACEQGPGGSLVELRIPTGRGPGTPKGP